MVSHATAPLHVYISFPLEAIPWLLGMFRSWTIPPVTYLSKLVSYQHVRAADFCRKIQVKP
jgi:hypothetical protein